MIKVGVKSDPILYRYSFEWLFDIMNRTGTEYLQLGSFFELYSVEDDYFHVLKEKADKHKIRIKSVFTANRELGGFLTGDVHLERVARKNYERLIHVASLLGADFCGSNPGAVYRNQLEKKQKGIDCFINHMEELSVLAKEKGLEALNIEPMSSLAEPPATPREIDDMMTRLAKFHNENLDTSVPVLLCGDISHGLIDSNYKVVYDNIMLFEHCIPYMSEFHFKNTDKYFNSTFGFSEEECSRGIIDLEQIKKICLANGNRWPIEEVVGYLEINGPKLGRDYSDIILEKQLSESLTKLHRLLNLRQVE